MLLSINLNNLPINIFREGKYYIADCRPIDIAVQGKSLNDVLQNFTKAVEMLIEYAKENDILEEVFLELGWSKENNQLITPNMLVLLAVKS